MLLERESELDLVARRLDPGGDSGGTIAFCGEPGVGKSRILAAAADAAPGLVLSARGVEAENELPFVGLRDLLAPVLAHAEDLPDPQRRALLSALAIEDSGPVEPFALRVAVLTLLSTVARDGWLLVAVDDVHWLDAASADVLRFVARRLSSERVLLLLSSREPPEGFGPGIELRTVPRLSAQGVRELVLARGAWRDAALVARELHAATGGNPLAVTELLERDSEALMDAVRVGRPLPVTDLIRAAFERRLSGLPVRARTALLVAAAAETRELPTVVAAAERLGAGVDLFDAAEAAGVVSIEDARLQFRHPIMRSVVYSGANAVERRAAHRALAQVALANDRADEAAWQRALAAALPDEEVAAALDAAASRYERRSGNFAAARALQQAAALTPGDDGRAERLHRAAEAARRAGRSAWAYDLLDQATDAAQRPRLRAEIDFTRTLLLSWSGSAADALGGYEALAARVAATEPELAARSYGYAAAQAIVAGRIATARRDAEEGIRIVRRGETGADATAVVMEALGTVMVLSGDPAGAQMTRDAARTLEESGELTGREYLATALLWIEEYELAERLLAPRLTAARAAGDVRALTATLDAHAALRFRVGDWRASHAAAAESARLAEESDQSVQLAYSLATLAIVQAGQGHPETAESIERSRATARAHGLVEIEQYLAAAGGLLQLGLGHADVALVALEEAAAYAERAGQREPAVHQWAADLIEAAVLTGERARAVRAIEALATASDRLSRRWGQAVAARGRAMLAPFPEYEVRFDAALALHEHTTAPFERGRIHLWWGRRLRRDRRRVDSRRHLDAARDIFEELGARPWAEAAARELQASGARLRPRDARRRDELTAHERQIASLAIGGASNKEIAGEMFLSPKTIETHLSRIYRKLDVRSRSELAARVLEGESSVAELVGVPYGDRP